MLSRREKAKKVLSCQALEREHMAVFTGGTTHHCKLNSCQKHYVSFKKMSLFIFGQRFAIPKMQLNNVIY